MHGEIGGWCFSSAIVVPQNGNQSYSTPLAVLAASPLKAEARPNPSALLPLSF
jgi:hypothetical protein